jgi:hypothetical protein
MRCFPPSLFVPLDFTACIENFVVTDRLIILEKLQLVCDGDILCKYFKRII